MSEVLQKLRQVTSEGTPSTTSLPALADGLMPLDLRAGQTISQSAPQASPANLLVLPEQGKEKTMNDTSCRTLSNLLSNAMAIYSSEARANISSELKGAGTPALVSEWINTEWTNPEWLYCRDDKWRPIKPGVKPLVDGVPRRVVPSNDRNTEALEIDCENTQEARVMRLKGYGNAIVPQVAAQFIKAFMNV